MWNGFVLPRIGRMWSCPPAKAHGRMTKTTSNPARGPADQEIHRTVSSRRPAEPVKRGVWCSLIVCPRERAVCGGRELVATPPAGGRFGERGDGRAGDPRTARLLSLLATFS